MFIGVLLWLFYRHQDSCMARLAGAHTWQCWTSSLPFILSFGGLVLHLSLSLSLSPRHSLFQPALSLSLQFRLNTIDIHLCVWDRGFGLCRCHVFSLLPVKPPSRSSLSLCCPRLCCDPCVGGGASREHRGADETLGMPAGGEEPGASAGESPVEASLRLGSVSRAATPAAA